VAFGGIQIECSTYSRILSRMEDFRVKRGRDLADDPFFSMLKKYPYPFRPTLLATAVPGGPVEAQTYERLKQEFLERLKDLLPLDGLYLAMHGALYVEGRRDADGDWISAARGIVGKDCLITASFDLHGNLSRRIIDDLDMLSAFRTAPHIDREETTQRACDMLHHCLNERIRPIMVWAPIPVLMPGERTSTLYEPSKGLWAQLPGMNARPGVLDASLLVGYVWAVFRMLAFQKPVDSGGERCVRQWRLLLPSTRSCVPLRDRCEPRTPLCPAIQCRTTTLQWQSLKLP
jgi:microcystin degradation protein MlrC